MRKNFGSKPMLYPMPVFIIATYAEDGTPSAMNAAWGGMADTHLISICLGEHKTTRNIFARKAFTVSMADAENVVAADFVGIVSGDKVPDKLARAGWHTTKSEFVDAPLLTSFPWHWNVNSSAMTKKRACSSERSSMSVPRNGS